ncbi:hypothetical protein PGR6_10470 [Pseudomonas sp. GR 6-02]|nr:hypothetical protein PGR6_10470 [Pseudomonas sp. GR 6-02]
MDSINKLSRLIRRMNRKASFMQNIFQKLYFLINQIVI